RARFMACDHRTRPAAARTSGQGIVNRFHRATGDAEYVFDSGSFEAGDDPFGRLDRDRSDRLRGRAPTLGRASFRADAARGAVTGDDEARRIGLLGDGGD